MMAIWRWLKQSSSLRSARLRQGFRLRRSYGGQDGGSAVALYEIHQKRRRTVSAWTILGQALTAQGLTYHSTQIHSTNWCIVAMQRVSRYRR